MRYPRQFKDVLSKKTRINASFVLDQKLISRGGCAGNIAYGFKAIGFEDFQLVSVLGKGDSQVYLDYFEQNNIDTSLISVVNGYSSCAYISTDHVLDQLTFFIANGAIEESQKYLRFGDPKQYGLAILAPHNLNLIKEAFEFIKQNRIDLVFDPGQQISVFGQKLFMEVLANSKFLILNKQELEYAMQLYGLTYDQILKMVEYLIVTDSENPVVIESTKHNYKQEFPAKMSSKVVDPTGCGDAFRAGFFAGYMQESDFDMCVEKAMSLAGLCLGSAVTQDYL